MQSAAVTWNRRAFNAEEREREREAVEEAVELRAVMVHIFRNYGGGESSRYIIIYTSTLTPSAAKKYV